MKCKLIKYNVIGIFLLLAFIGIKEVKAETYTGQAIWPSEHISNIYIKNTPKIYTKESNTKDNNYSKYSVFFSTFSKYSSIPGLNQGGIPQGLCYSNKYNILLISFHTFSAKTS